MENQENYLQQNSPSGDFGMTDQDLKDYKLKSFFQKLRYYFSFIEPVLVKLFNTIAYWTIKFAKSIVSSVFKMITGKEF
jgi:hypothetical protein